MSLAVTWVSKDSRTNTILLANITIEEGHESVSNDVFKSLFWSKSLEQF